MADIQSVTAEIRRGRKKKEETTGQKYNGLHRVTTKNLSWVGVALYVMRSGNGFGPILEHNNKIYSKNTKHKAHRHTNTEKLTITQANWR